MSTVTDKELLQQLRDSPRGQKIVKEKEKAWLTDRRECVAAIEKLTAEHEKAVPDLVAAEEAAAEKVEAARHALETAQEGWRIAHAARRGATSQFDAEKGRLEAELVASAPPVDDFIGEMEELFQRTRREGVRLGPEARDRLTGESRGRESNAASVAARLRAIEVAKKAAEATRLEALTHDELRKRLEAIRAAIPEVGR